jgi:purine-binding chemotaxis protein CheW
VIDTRAFIGLEFTSAYSGRMLVVRLLDEEFAVGLLVDSVEQIVTVPPDEIRPPASPLEGGLSSYLTGVCQIAGAPVAVLNLDRLLRSPEIRQFEDPRDVEVSA